MPQHEPDVAKLKVTSLLVQISEQEKHYLKVMLNKTGKYDGMDVNPPHLLNISVLSDGFVPLWYTIEPWLNHTDEAVQGWDPYRRVKRSFKWDVIVDGSLNSQVYEPVPNAEWERRTKTTNLEHQAENLITQTKAKYR